MSEPIVFRECLRVLTHESRRLAETTDDSELPRLLGSFNGAFLSALRQDKLSVLKHIASTIIRILNRVVSATLCEIVHVKHLLAVTDCLKTVLVDLMPPSQNLCLPSDLLSLNTMLLEPSTRIVCLLIGIFESLKNKMNVSKLNADEEAITINSFSCFERLLVYFTAVREKVTTANQSLHESHQGKVDLQSVLKGPLLAQLVQSSIHFASHPSKEISHSSLHCLLQTLEFASDVVEWRNYIPGVFSGLHVVCMSGYKRGSSVLCLALLCTLKCLSIVSLDDHIDNKEFRVSSIELDETATKVTADFVAAEMRKVMAKVAASGLASTSLALSQEVLLEVKESSSSVDVVVPKHSREDPSMATKRIALNQWRVDLLQRVQPALPVAFSEVYRVCSPRQRLLLVQALHQLLHGSRGFLGNTCFLEFLFLMFPSADDSVVSLRSSSRDLVSQLMKRERRLQQWSTTSSGIVSKWISSVRSAAKLAEMSCGGPSVTGVMLRSIGDQAESRSRDRRHDGPALADLDSKMHALLSTSIGCVSLLTTEVEASLFASSEIAISSLQLMFTPDLDSGTKSMLLESRRFYFPPVDKERHSYLDLGYYRVPFLATRDAKCLTASRRLSAMMGVKGVLPTILSMSQSLLRKVERETYRYIISSEFESNGYVDSDRQAVPPSQQLQASESNAVAITSTTKKTQSNERISRLRAAISMWHVLQSAVLGLKAVPKPSNVPHSVSSSNNAPDTTDSPTDATARKLKCKFGDCALCGKSDSSSRCSRCKSIYYCSPEHQRKHWTLHKKSCNPPSVATVQTVVAAEVSQSNLGVVESDASANAENQYGLLDDDIVDPITVPSLPDSFPGPTTSAASAHQPLGLRKEACEHYQDPASLLEGVIQLILDTICWYGDVSSITEGANRKASRERQSEKTSVELLGRNILVSLALECLASIAYVMETEFRNYLQQTLYRIVELSVESEAVVRTAALTTIHRIARYSGYINLNDLYRVNIDYLVDGACAELRSRMLKLRELRYFRLKKKQQQRGREAESPDESYSGSRVHLVVQAVFDAVGQQLFDGDHADTQSPSLVGTQYVTSISLLKDMILETMASIDVTISTAQSAGLEFTTLLQVMKVLVVRSMSPVSAPSPDSTADIADPSTSQSDDVFDAMKSLRDFRNSINILLSPGDPVQPTDLPQDTSMNESERGGDGKDGEDDHAEDAEDVDDGGTTVQPSPAEKLILDILFRCCYFMAAPQLRDQLLAVEIMAEAFKRLARNRRVLLPAIHKNWPTIVSRMKQMRHTFLTTADGVLSYRSASLASSPHELLADRPKLELEVASADKVIASALTRSIDKKRKESVYGEQSPPGSSKFSKTKINLLPPLLDFLGLLAKLSEDFFSIKFQEDLWPELLLLHLHVHKLEKKNLTEFLAKEEKRHPRSVKLPAGPTSTASTSQPAASSSSSFSSEPKALKTMYQRTIIALLEFWLQFLSLSCSRSYVHPYAGVVVWLLAPLLASHQTPEVHDLVRGVFMRMYRMNSALVRMVLEAILSCQSRAQRHDSWSAIISLPAIVNACCNEMYCIQYASEQGLRTDSALTVSVFGDRMQRDLSSPAAASVPGADKLRAAYCSDAGLHARINGVMSESHIDVDLEAESGDAVWKGCLRQWASV